MNEQYLVIPVKALEDELRHTKNQRERMKTEGRTYTDGRIDARIELLKSLLKEQKYNWRWK